MKEINNDNYKLLYNKKVTDKPNIILEIYKGKLYCNLLKNFIKVCNLNFNEKIFTLKKSFSRTLTNLLSSWFFSLYSKYDFTSDSFFPSNFHDTNLLEIILLDYCSVDKSITDKEQKIKNIITNLKDSYKIILEQLNVYLNSEFYQQNKNKFKIYKSKITEKRNTPIDFYKFRIAFKCDIFINNIRLKNILNNIIIPVYEYNKMKNKFTGFPDELDYYIFIILFRYQLLGSNNHQLAVLPNILDKMKLDFNLSIECFASSINSESNIFCSLYYDTEKYFGSIGSFFNVQLVRGFYSFNPPYQVDIIETGILKIFDFFENTNEDLGFIITIPIWDNNGKKYMEDNDLKNNNDVIEYADFEIMNLIKESKYFNGLKMISKDEFTYIDHNFHLFKNTTIQYTYIILLSNFKNNYFDIIDKYDFYTFKDIVI